MRNYISEAIEIHLWLNRRTNQMEGLSRRLQEADVFEAPLHFGPFPLLHWVQASGIPLEGLVQYHDNPDRIAAAVSSQVGQCLQVEYVASLRVQCGILQKLA